MLTVDPADRALGLVWRDPARDGLPATHVLIAGVGRFADPALAPLTSPPASARAFASWFLDSASGRGTGFAHPERPLGSLALLLSENADGSASTIEGGPVPRATLAGMRTALRAWVDRARAVPDATAILIIASHGQSFQRQTAVLFEDYGSDPLDPYAGMTEVDQLVDALSTLPPDDKLLVFDCCRMPTDLGLIPGRTYGTPLIGGLPLPPGTMPRRPQVLRSTRHGDGALGRTGRPTLFAEALLDALRGTAAEPADDWRVLSTQLAGTAERILGLWRAGAERLQEPEFQLSAAFTVAQVPETDEATLYLSFAPPHELAEATVEVWQDGTLVTRIDGQTATEPFARIPLPERVAHRIVAQGAGGTPIGEIAVKVPAPVAFRELPPRGGVTVTRPKALAAAPGPATLSVVLPPMPGVPAAGHARMAARIAPRGDSGEARAAARAIALDGDGHETVSLPPGRWAITLSRPDGADWMQEVEVGGGESVALTLAPTESPHEWLAEAVMAGAVDPPEPPFIPARLRREMQRQQRQQDPAPPPPPPAPDVRPVRPDGSDAAAARILPEASNARFHRFGVEDTLDQRYPAAWSGGPAGEADLPLWADIRGPGWHERAFVPSQGVAGRYAFRDLQGEADPWRAGLVVDLFPPGGRSHAAGFVTSGLWGGLLAFLARRDFEGGATALAALAERTSLRDAVLGKVQNPLAATAAALIAVATGQTGALDIPEDWLANLAQWFPGLPDGPVILARMRMRAGRPAGDLLDQALARGVPVHSLAVDWLAEALAMTGHPAAGAARARARATDPTRAYTVTRITGDAP